MVASTQPAIQTPLLYRSQMFNMDDEADAAEYEKRVQKWESQPEWEECDTD